MRKGSFSFGRGRLGYAVKSAGPVHMAGSYARARRGSFRPYKENLMRKKWMIWGVAAACVLWTGLFFLARWNEGFRQNLPVAMLVVLGHDDGVRDRKSVV